MDINLNDKELKDMIENIVQEKYKDKLCNSIYLDSIYSLQTGFRAVVVFNK